jgi:hypothetical protein
MSLDFDTARSDPAELHFHADETYCYLKGSRIRSALKHQRVLDALIDELQVPGKASRVRNLSMAEKVCAITDQVFHYCHGTTSIWCETSPEDVVAAALWRSRLVNPLAAFDVFCSVRREDDLVEPVRNWLEADGFDAFTEVAMGRCRADVVGHRKAGLFGLRPQRVIAVELKNDLGQLRRGLDQMVTYNDYAHEVYLACTPALAIQYLDSHANARAVQHWDSEVLDRKLEKFGLGLLLVEGNEVHMHLEASRSKVCKSKLAELEGSFGSHDD